MLLIHTVSGHMMTKLFDMHRGASLYRVMLEKVQWAYTVYPCASLYILILEKVQQSYTVYPGASLYRAIIDRAFHWPTPCFHVCLYRASSICIMTMTITELVLRAPID